MTYWRALFLEVIDVVKCYLSWQKIHIFSALVWFLETWYWSHAGKVCLGVRLSSSERLVWGKLFLEFHIGCMWGGKYLQLSTTFIDQNLNLAAQHAFILYHHHHLHHHCHFCCHHKSLKSPVTCLCHQGQEGFWMGGCCACWQPPL